MGVDNILKFHWCLIVIFIACAPVTAQDSPEPTVLRSSPAYEFLRPLELTQERIRRDYPSLEGIDWTLDEASPLAFILRHLEAEGIPIIIGAEANAQSSFELYLPVVEVALGLPPLKIVGPDSEAGGEYYKYHDSTHLLAGIPGPRLSDLENKEESRQRWIDIMLRKEHVATTWSFMIFLRDYWNWRHEVYGEERGEGNRFEEFNQGIYNIGRMDRETYVDMLGDSIKGEPWAYFKKLRRTFDPKFIREADRQGVPVPLPRFGIPGELHILKWVTSIVEPILSYYRSAGYKGFMKFNEVTVDYMLQDWYVRWADRFQFGMPIDEIDAHVDSLIEQLKRGETIGRAEPVQEGEFHISFLLNEVALLARRLAEFRAFAREKSTLNDEALGKADDIYESLAELHDRLRAYKEIATEFDPVELESYRDVLRFDLGELEKNFDVEALIPAEDRIPFINYRNFWRNPNAVLFPREMENAGGFSPAEIREFRRIEKSFQRNAHTRMLYRRLGRFMFVDVNRVVMAEDYFHFRRALSRSYERGQAALIEPEWTSSKPFDRWKEIFEFQLEHIVLPQVLEASHLTDEQRVQLIQELRLAWSSVLHDFDDRFSSEEEVLALQYDFLDLLERHMMTTRDLLVNLRRKKKFSKLRESRGSAKRYKRPVAISPLFTALEMLKVDFIELEREPNAQKIRPYFQMAHWIDGEVLRKCGAVMRRARSFSKHK